jgi:branched-chain amino acid transport system ATP-binding protein
MTTSTPEFVLEARNLAAGYGSIPVLHGIDLRVRPGEVVALLGPNGAGKTTTMLALSGELPRSGGEVLFDGRPASKSLYKLARNGLSYVTEERSVFMELSVHDNLKIGGCDAKAALALFPELEKRIRVHGGMLSGGEQQMLTLARALARKPRLLLADELSLGLAPIVVKRLLDAVRAAATDTGAGVLVVEQHARKVLAYANRAYVLHRGQVVLDLTAEEARQRIGEIEDSYLTSAAAETSAPA